MVKWLVAKAFSKCVLYFNLQRFFAVCHGPKKRGRGHGTKLVPLFVVSFKNRLRVRLLIISYKLLKVALNQQLNCLVTAIHTRRRD